MIYMYICCFIGTVLFTALGILLSLNKAKIPSGFINAIKGISFGMIVGLLIGDILTETFEGFTEKYSSLGILYVLLIVAGSCGLFYLIHFICDKATHEKHHEDGESHHIHLHEDKPLIITSLLFLVSVSLHNIPEGFSFGASFVQNVTSGALMTVVLGLHNFVIGYCLSESFLNNNFSKGKTFIVTIMSGIISYAFAIGGYYLGEISEIAKMFILSISAGALLFVILKELLPGLIYSKSKHSILYVTLGLLVVIIILII